MTGAAYSDGPNRFSVHRALQVSTRKAGPPATTRPIQLAHIGTDQSPIMTGQSIINRTRWNTATTAKITPATRENVFRSISDHPTVGGISRPSVLADTTASEALP